MGRLINKLERRFGKYAISNLAVYIIGAYIIGYLFEFINSGFMDALTLNPYRIFHGEVWRLITWVLVPPSRFNIFTIIMLLFYYNLARSLENTWGAFRFNLYIFSGMIMTIIGAIIYYFVEELTIMKDFTDSLEGLTDSQISAILSSGGYDINSLSGFKDLHYRGIFSLFSTYYINLSIFLAFAACYPDMQVLLYFIIPVKIKWMAYLDVFILGFDIISYIRNGLWAGVVAVVVSLLNFIVFFFGTRDMQRVSPREIRRKRNYNRQVNQATRVRITKHKCAICGRTNEDDDSLEFRFCSKCQGNYEYCQDHLFTHEHVKF